MSREPPALQPPPHELRRLLNATRYSWQGLAAAVRHERAFRLELIAALVLLPLAFYLGNTGVERALLAGVVLLLMVVELLNSAVEATVNRIGYEHHPLAGRAKDLGSAAVFLTLVLAATVWLLILFG